MNTHYVYARVGRHDTFTDKRAVINQLLNCLHHYIAIISDFFSAMIVAKVNHYDGMFAETAPGAWLGCFFLFVAGMGLAIRRRAQRKVTIPRSLLTLYIITTIIVACIALAMISYITDVMITDRSQYRLWLRFLVSL